MNLNKGDIIRFKQEKYIIIEQLEYNNENYVFSNKIKNMEEIGEEFYIFKIIDNNASKITDERLIEMLLEKFKIIINKDIDDLIKINEC